MPTHMKLPASIISVVVVGAGVIWYLGRSASIGPLATSPSPVPILAPSKAVSPSRTQPPSPSPRDALGWPTNGSNSPGLYAWGDNRCAGTTPGQRTHCVYGVMDKHDDSGRVAIRITIGVVSAKPIEIAGHAGTYQRTYGGGEEWRDRWIVEIDGVTVAVTLTAEAGASGADIAEAHAIVESLRYEPRTNALGFRLVFTLTTKGCHYG